MKVFAALCIAAAVGIGLGAGENFAQGQGATSKRPILSQLDQETQSLYQDIARSLVRIEANQSPLAVLDPYNLKPDFQAWQQKHDQRGRDGRSGGAVRSGGGGPGGGGGQAANSLPPPQGSPAGRGPGGGGRGGFGGPDDLYRQVGAFLSDQADKTTDPNMAEIYRGLALKLAVSRSGRRGEMTAVLLDDAGHILVLTGLLREASTEPLDVTLSDGSKTTATFIGGDLYGEYSILQLARKGSTVPIHWGAKPAPGQMLMPVSAAEGSAGSFVRPDRQGRLSLTGDDRGADFMFNVDGELCMITSGASGWTGDRQSLGSNRMQREIGYIETGGAGGKATDIEPRSLGITFSPLNEKQAKALEHQLAGRRAINITGVESGSLAAKAGLKKDDVLVSIDNRPISDLVSPDARQLPEMLQLRADLATRDGQIALGIIRGDQEQTLQMPLK